MALNSLEQRSAVVAQLAETFEAATGHRCSANLYHSPAGRVGGPFQCCAPPKGTHLVPQSV